MKRQTFVVIARRGLSSHAIGVYRSFKAAEGFANAWDGHNGYNLFVLPLSKVDDLSVLD